MEALFKVRSPVRLVLALCACLLASALPCSTSAQDRAALERQFRDWLAGDLWQEASAQGVSRHAFERATNGLALDWTLPDLAPPGAPPPEAQRQAEFSSPGAYFKESRLTQLAAIGRRQLATWQSTLDEIERRYGVPRRIVVAIWGRESAFGSADGGHHAMRALATLAFMGRRKAFFRRELVAALQIVEAGHITPERMKSSWAGAMGQPQFLPSMFLDYAVDHDGDGRRDIWGSVPDALASIANHLARHGWQAGRDWGFEVDVPASVSCALEGPDRGKPIGEWASLGIARVAGRTWPEAELAREGFLLMPAGRHGPAFIATANFYVLKSYNESDLYALYIGNLADRFSTDRPFVAPWGKVGRFNRGDVRRMQERLQAMGHDVGGVDGLVGYKTRRSIGAWQTKAGLAQTCFPDTDLIRRLR